MHEFGHRRNLAKHSRSVLLPLGGRQLVLGLITASGILLGAAGVLAQETPPTDRLFTDRVRGDLEITFLLEDRDGNSTPIQKSSLPLDLPAAAGASGPRHITYDVGFTVRAGEQRLALTVTDTLGAVSSTVSWDLTLDKDGAVTVTER